MRAVIGYVLMWALTLGACTWGEPDYEGDDPGECSDGADNDRDGRFDCADLDCDGAPACTAEAEVAEADAERVVANEDPPDVVHEDAPRSKAEREAGYVGTRMPPRPVPEAEGPAVGDCWETTVKSVTGRLGGASFNMGISVTFEDGTSLVGYDAPEVARIQQPGDPVRICLISVPEDCPPGDDRGWTYSVHDEKRGGSYELANSSHMCGGA